MRAILLVALVLAASCTGHVPPVVPSLGKPHTYTLPLEALNTDAFCVQTNSPIYSPCWNVGYLRAVMIGLKAE